MMTGNQYYSNNSNSSSSSSSSNLIMRSIVLWCLLIDLVTRATHAQYEKKYGNAGKYLNSYRCELDPKVTPENFHTYEQDISDLWGSLCALNRGIFVLDPPDGQTYNCGKFPREWNVTLQNMFTSAIPEQAVAALDKLMQAAYNTSEYQMSNCEFGSLSQLVCGRENPWQRTPWYEKLKAPIRAVNIGGLFVLERWIVPDLIPWGEDTGIVDQYTFSQKCAELGICDILVEHWNTYYTQEDFYEMKRLGLNSIRFPIGHWYFTELSGYPNHPYIIPEQSILANDHPITKIIRYAKNAGLYVILDLHTAPGSQNGFDNSGHATNDPQPDRWGQEWIYDRTHVDGTVATNAAMATYLNHIENEFELDNIIMMEILNEPWEDIDLSLIKTYYVKAIKAVRDIRPGLPILMHDSFRGDDWGTLLKDWQYDHVYLDTHSYQCFNLWDLASDSPKSDRNKLYAHELESCANKIPLHYETCNAVPVFVGEWSIAVDDCIPFLNARYEDVGQCDHIDLRHDDPYWQNHLRSFAMRQISTFERELGWSFWNWKLSDFAEKNEAPNSWYWSFRLAVQHGYIDLTNNTEILHACDYDPPEDYPTGGDAVNGTDDGGMDDLTNTNYPPYSSLPPGEEYDTPFELNRTQIEIIHEWMNKNNYNDNYDKDKNMPSTSSTYLDTRNDNHKNMYNYSFIHTVMIAISSFLLGLIVQRYISLNELKSLLSPSSSSSSSPSSSSSFHLSNLPSTVLTTSTRTQGSYQRIDDSNNNDYHDYNDGIEL